MCQVLFLFFPGFDSHWFLYEGEIVQQFSQELSPEILYQGELPTLQFYSVAEQVPRSDSMMLIT